MGIDKEDQQNIVTGSNLASSTSQISLNVLAGTPLIPSFSAMRLSGVVRNKRVYILIDSSSTHNFLDFNTAAQVGCKITACPPISMHVADGNKIQCSSISPVFLWKMQGLEYEANIYVASCPAFVNFFKEKSVRK